jgi:hypothetical protein
MAIQQPLQPAPKKKSGMGCLGCGCLILVLIFLLIAGLAAGVVYMGFKGLNGFSSAQPLAFTPYSGGEDNYANAQKKITAFNQDVSASRTSTLTLSADEINSLIAHTDGLKQFHAQVLVSMQGDELRLQGEIPTDFVPFINLGVKNRYFNLDATTGVSFNSDTKEIELDLHKLQFGDTVVPQNSLASLQASFSQSLNQQLQQNPGANSLLQHTQSITIKDGQFVIETK